MRKIILTVLGVFLFSGIAQADVCMKIQRQEHWMTGLDQRDIAKLNHEERLEYEARTRPFDVIVVYHADQCSIPPEVQDPTSAMITVVIYGLDYEDALRYQNSSYDLTGEPDSDTGKPTVNIKHQHKFRIANENLPGSLKSLFDHNSYLVFQWEEIRDFFENKETGVIGE
jgi:hypothetical protein